MITTINLLNRFENYLVFITSFLVSAYVKYGVGRFHPFYRPRRPLRRVALLCCLDHCTKRVWGVSVTPRPLSTPGKDPVPIVQEAGWTSRPVWTGPEFLAPNGIWSPDHPARSQSLYRHSYLAQKAWSNKIWLYIDKFMFLCQIKIFSNDIVVTVRHLFFFKYTPYKSLICKGYAILLHFLFWRWRKQITSSFLQTEWSR
jgi:hypothetical protein